MSDRGFATGPDPFSGGFVDNRDKRIAQLEAENAALKAERDAARAWAAAWRRKAMKSYAMYVHMHAIYHRSNGSANIFGVPYESVVDNALKLFSRAISGTAQRARSWRRMEEVSRRARRAAEAADAQERR